MTQPVRHFHSDANARNSFRAVLDAASAGLVTTIDRDNERFVVVSAARQRDLLVALRPSRAEVIEEGGGWSVILPGLPVHGDGDTFDTAVEDALEALREYAADWNERLHTVSNHRGNDVVVALVELSDDDQLRDWVLGGAVSANH